MAPGGPGKRKRGDRSWSGDSGNDGQRPSPHRPGNLNMAQQGQGRDFSDSRGRGGRRPSRGNRNVAPTRRMSDGQSLQNQRKDTSSPSKSAASPPASSARDNAEPSRSNGMQAAARSNPPSQSVSTSKLNPAPTYNFEYLKPEYIEKWLSTGKEAIVKVGTSARNDEDPMKLALIFQEIVRSAFDSRISATEGGASIKEILGEQVAEDDVDMVDGTKTSGSKFDPRSIFLDTLSILTDSDTSNPALRPLVFSTGISPALMRHELETPLLQALGLIRDTFARMGIRKQTNLLYRQSNYNLLREESEGYSKLLTELFTTSSNEPPSSEVVEDTFEKVKAMIGAFDMDVGRVLDVTLDVFAAVLVKQYRFFVKFLRVSSWWPKDEGFRKLRGDTRDSGLPAWALPGSSGWVTTDEEREDAARRNEERDKKFWRRVNEIGIRAFFEIGRCPVPDSERAKYMSEVKGKTQEEVAENRKWIEETGTLPPQGNRVAAQLLGFKLRFYSSPARNPSDVLPDNLIYLAALLIKVGFISFRDLYPHLWRPDDSMEALKEEKMAEKAERERAARPGAGAMNALMAAGALSDDTLPGPPRPRETEARAATPAKDQEADKATAAKPEDKDALPEPADQKVLLLKSMLAIGAIPESLYILGRFPWLLDAYPELPEFIHRILHQCLSKVYASSGSPDSRHQQRDTKRVSDLEQTGVPKGQVRLVDAPSRRVLRWALLDKEDTNDGTDYRFYWDDWADNIPICQTVDDVFSLCNSFLNILGVKIAQDPTLLMKIVRIGKHSLNDDYSDANKTRWRDLCKRLLVPSLSLTKENPGVANELFELLNNFPREERYSIYAEWYTGQISRLADIKSAFDQAKAETKDTLKRLSKTNIRPMARALAKIAYANPGIVVNVAISQIESYENLIEVVVECARYFTYLGYDVLTWSLVSSLGHKGRSRVQEGGLLTSRWLNALALFTGRAFKRYSVMNPVPVFQYVVDQLRQNNSTDLVVLEQMISSMAGIITDTSFNDAQIQAMAGGELLQAQTMLQLLDKRHESRTTSKRLMKSLTDSKLAGQLLIAIAQERVTCVFKELGEDAELKLIGNIFDEIHRVLTQYLDLLRSNFTIEEFDATVPEAPRLISEFGIQPEVAFWISRPSIAKQIADLDKQTQEEVAKKKESEPPSESKSPDGDVEMADDGEAVEGGDKVSSETAETVEKGDSTEANGDSPIDRPDSAQTTPGWNPVLQNLMDGISSAMPSEVWETVGLAFYVTFWQLSLYDIHVPQKAYEDEIERQKKKVVTIGNDRSDVSVAGTQRKEREKKQIAELQDRILEENKQHLRAYGRTRSRLQKEKDRWFAGMRGKHDALNIAIMEQCLLPRILLSPVDAFYCFKLLKYLHTSGTPNFRTVGLLDQLFRDQRLSALIFLCSSKESDNLGCFLHEVLRDLSRWHADKAVYEKEAYGSKRDLQGFATALDPEGKPTTFLDYEDFRRLLYKWHRILGGSLKTCLTSGEYMHIRNAISVLKAIVQYFPAVNWIGRDMHTVVENISKTADRKDIQTPAASLIGDLNRREKKWMLPQAFMIVSLPASKVQDGANPSKNENVPNDKNAAGKSRPQSASTTPKPMSATAPEFKPTAVSANVNGTEKPQAASRTEVEDGEIEDAKMTDVNSKAEDKTPQQAEDAENKMDTTEKQPEPAENGVSTTADKDADENTKNEAPPEEPPSKEEEPEPAPRQPSEPSRPASEPTSEPQPEVPARTSHSPTRSRTDQPPASQSPVSAGTTKRDVDRNQSSSISSIRPQPHLPNRPEPPRDFRRSDMRVPMRPPDVPDERFDARDSRHQDHSRYGRYHDQDRERAPDHPVVGERSHGRLNERPPARGGERDFPSRPPSDDHFQRPPFRDSHLPPRDQEWSERTPRARQSQSDLFASRQHEQDRSTRNMAPPHKPPQHHERGGIRDGPSADDDNTRAPSQTRTDRDDRRTHPSRQQSPARVDDNRLPSRPDRRDDRFPSDDRRSGSFSQGHAPRPDDLLPTGPRGERSSRQGVAEERLSNDFSRDSRGGQLPSQDPNHGRLNQGSRYAPPAHDSLNDRPPPDIPLGPRGRNASGRGSRPGSISQGPPPNNPPPAQVPERQPPTGPSNRPGTRGAPRQEQPASSNSRPPTPASEKLDTSGIHPDRLKALQQSSNAGFDSPPARAPSPPSGPRGAPSGPSPTTRGPPTGPTFAGERGRGDKRFAGLNNMLQQSSGTSSDRSGQGTTIRGRGANRQSGASMNAPSPQSMGPPTPVGPQSESQGASAEAGSGRERPDLFAGNKNEPEDESSTPTRSGGGRRPELIESSSEPRRSSRNLPSGTNTPDRERERERDRTRPRDRDRDRDRERERDGSRRGEEDGARAPGRRDLDRDRRASENVTSSREEIPDSREASRRSGGSGRDEGPSTRRRERRGRDEGVNSSSLGSGEYGSADRAKPPPPPPPPPPQNDGRRWGGAGGGGGGGRSEERERDRDHGRGRDRNRDRRDENNAGGILPRKRGRPPAGDEGPRGGGMRVGSEHKRPRR